MTHYTFCLALAACLVMSVSGKALRYGAPPIDTEARAVAVIESQLKHDGWLRDLRDERDVRHVYAFAKPQCLRPLLVAMIGTGAETLPMLNARHRGQLQYFQDGRAVAQPSIWRSHVTFAVRSLGQLASGRWPSAVPLFAVSVSHGEAPPSTAGPGGGSAGPCSFPSRASWEQFLDRRPFD